MAWLFVLAYSESEVESNFGNINDDWLNTEWKEYEDRFDFWWNDLITPLEIAGATLFDITAISELSIQDALSNQSKPWELAEGRYNYC